MPFRAYRWVVAISGIRILPFACIIFGLFLYQMTWCGYTWCWSALNATYTVLHSSSSWLRMRSKSPRPRMHPSACLPSRLPLNSACRCVGVLYTCWRILSSLSISFGWFCTDRFDFSTFKHTDKKNSFCCDKKNHMQMPGEFDVRVGAVQQLQCFQVI